MKKALLVALSSGLFLTACGEHTPNCSAFESKELVNQLLREEFQKQFQNPRAYQEFGSSADYFEFRLEGIRTTNRNEKLDSYLCAAEAIRLPISEQNIDGIVAKYSDEKNNIYRNRHTISDDMVSFKNRLISSFSAESGGIPIRYSIESADDSKNFYVQLDVN